MGTGLTHSKRAGIVEARWRKRFEELKGLSMKISMLTRCQWFPVSPARSRPNPKLLWGELISLPDVRLAGICLYVLIKSVWIQCKHRLTHTAVLDLSVPECPDCHLCFHWNMEFLETLTFFAAARDATCLAEQNLAHSCSSSQRTSFAWTTLEVY